MILRSLKLVHIRGLPEVVLSGLPAEGLVRVPLPRDADATVIADAIGFALAGTTTAEIVAAEPGFAYVELGLTFAGGVEASLFRGVDRSGVVQVSLREQGGERVTGRGVEVAARLAELIGCDALEWTSRAVVNSDGSPTSLDVNSATRQPASRTALVDVAHEALHDLQRGLRVDRLSRAAARAHDELLQHGARLRRQRAEVDRVVERDTAERDRVRTRLRRVNEFRDQIARSEAQDVGERAAAIRGRTQRVSGLWSPPAGSAEWGIAVCAALLLATLALYVTAATEDPDRPLVSFGLGLAFLITVSSYFVVAGAGTGVAQRADATAGDSERRARTIKDALRHRFADLSDPEDPALPRRLRERLRSLDAKLVPIHARLEALDDAITIFDVEAGRAARALHQARSEPALADEGLPEGMEERAAVQLVHDLGDAVYALSVERDALMAGGEVDVAAARRALAEALRSLGGGDGRSVSEALRQVDALADREIDDADEGERVEALFELIVRIEREGAAGAVRRDAPSGREGNGSRFVILRSMPARTELAALVSTLRTNDPAVRQVIVGCASDVAGEDASASRGQREQQPRESTTE